MTELKPDAMPNKCMQANLTIAEELKDLMFYNIVTAVHARRRLPVADA